ncbi:MAG: CPBP family intramembrane metalloprotease [Candidatus Cloacimonetes bacterium]|nr:CPBP family intramembrane metalloprotease [Candidatus Cloacimonadota bacterium]
MKNNFKIVLIIAFTIVFYYVFLSVIPKLDIFDELKKNSSLIGNGDITQSCFLIFSVLILIAFKKGNFKEFGFRKASFKQIIKPVPISIGVAFLTIILNVITMMTNSSSNNSESSIFRDKNIFETILSVWILASICEEIFWRGLVLGFLSPLTKAGITIFKKFLSVPVIISGLLFGLGHFCLLSSMNSRIVINIVISVTILGLIAGYHREKSGSLLPAIIVHLTFNIVGTMIPFILISLSGN